MSDMWKVVRIAAGSAAPEAVEELVAVLQSVYPTCGAHETETAGAREWRLFFEPEDLPRDIENSLKRTVEEIGFQEIEVLGIIDVPRENWQDNWREYFKPVSVSPTLEVRPSWYKEGTKTEDEQPDNLVLYIEPGMAFGTGTHATTQLCLRLAERLVRPGLSVLDCGTGSAILAIAAVKLGAGRTVGFDIDPEVEENARLNLQLNDLPPDSVTIHIGGLESVPVAPFDVIFCNMLSREFLPLLPDLPKYLSPGGRLILSGLLKTEETEIREAAQKVDLEIEQADSADEWAALVCTRKS